MHERAPQDRQRDRQGTGLIIAATGFAAVAVLGYQAIASRSLGPDDFAPVALLWTLMFLLHTILLLPAEQHLTRALVVTRTPSQLASIRRHMFAAFLSAFLIGVFFTALTLDRFFDGSAAYVVLIGLIVVSRALMSAGRGLLAGNRRFAAYGMSIGLEAAALLVGALVAAASNGNAIAFAAVIAAAPLATLLTRPFSKTESADDHHVVDAQPGTFLAWLVLATTASQLIIAGGPIAVSFVGGDAVAVSIFFTTFALLRGPLTSAYNVVARVLPDFTELAHGTDPGRLWSWATRISIAALVAAVAGAAGGALLLRPIVGAVYGDDFLPTTAMATLGGAGVGFGLGALFVTQVYSAAARGAYLAIGWAIGLLVSVVTLILTGLAPIDRVALAFVMGEGTGLAMLGVVLPRWARRSSHGGSEEGVTRPLAPRS